jgi:1-acyl-sn-glycerol-3-phosphate acyltransferase
VARREGDLTTWWSCWKVVIGALWRLPFRLQIVGSDRIPRSDGALMAANHVSALDGVLFALATAERAGRMTRFLVAAEFFRRPVIGWALRRFRHIPVRRGQPDAAALDDARAVITGGGLAGIFPEGTVNPDPETLQRGRSGVARLALSTGAPVVPTGIWGTQIRWPKAGLNFHRPLRTTNVIAYGEPIPAVGDPSSANDVQAFTELVMTRIAKQVDEARTIAEAFR